MSKLKLIRDEIGLSQIELAIEAEVPRYKVQLMDRGIACLALDEARRVAMALGRSPENMPSWLVRLVKSAGAAQ